MRLSRKSTQTTLFGEFVPTFPKVRTSRGYLLDWDRNRIIRQIVEETRLVEVFYGYKGADEETAKEIARLVEKKIQMLGLQSLSGPLIREIVNMTLLERGLIPYRNVCTRVGTPVFDAHLIDVGRGFEAHDNANLQENAETSHKKKADKISKEQYLLQLPPDLADHHLRGDLHIHDLEYFGTRPFCIDGSTVIPVRMEGRTRSIRPDELPIDGDEWRPDDLSVLTPKGWRRVTKVTRRRVNPGEMLRIRTSGGRSLMVTGEHRIPVQIAEGMTVRRADEVRTGDTLYRISATDALRGETIEAIDLVRELPVSVPAHLLENVYVRGAQEIFADTIRSGQAASYAAISRVLGVKHREQWYTRGIMPVALFSTFCSRYGVEDYAGVTIGVTGSEHELPALLALTPELIRLLGFFVSEGNYNVAPEVGQYNLAITENHQAPAIQAAACAVLNTYATITGGTPDTTTIYGVEAERNRALQVYFGGKAAYLLFRYVFGIPERAVEKRLPWIVYHLNDVLLHEFLSALFTGDGSVYYRPEKSDCIVNYTTASPTLRQELSLLLTALGMKPHIVELYADNEDRGTLYRLQINGRKNVEAFARYATFLDSRQDHIDGFLSAVKGGRTAEREETVVEIAPADPTGAYVYDLFIDGDGAEESHTFFASDGLLIHNCQDWDLRYFFYYGLMPDGNGTKASVAGPAKRAEVAVLHAVKALGSAQTNFAGGQGYYNFLTFLAPYFEGMDYDGIKQLMQMFVYEMTQMMVARGGQLVFSSVQLTPGVPKLWRDKPAVYAGRVWDGSTPDAPLKTYGKFEREVRLAFKALMEVMLQGDYWGKPFNFPKPEISIEPDFMKEDEEFNAAHPDLPTYQELYLQTFKLAAEYGTPYFDNQLPAYRGAGEGISCYQCCAYQFAATFSSDDQFDDKLRFRDGKHFSMGSWQVVSLNCPRAAYLARGDDDLLFEYLRELMDTSVEIFKVKRQWMNQIINNHRMPFATQQPRDPITGEMGSVAVGLDALVYTIGVVGVNEMVQFHTGKQMHESKEAWKLAVRAMTEMEIYARKLSEQHGMTIALARTPAETTAQRFAVSDLIHEEFRECAERVVKGDLDALRRNLHKTRDLPVYYTNGTHLPPSADVTIFERAKLEHVFFPIVDGGNIFHVFLGEATPDPQGLMDFGLRLARETQIGYFTFTKDMTVCLGCSQVSGGLEDKCPNCGSENVDHISRITGYLQAVSGWNSAKRQELKDRKKYNELA